jgi:alpha-L-fucosidase
MSFDIVTTGYVPEKNPFVKQNLEKWQSLKFGLMMHWGTYSQMGVLESWSICSEPEDWIRRPNDNYEEYKKQYRSLINTFNPEKFDPDKWARAAKNTGMRYVISTTKHHDGFCMFDTEQTEYKVTSKACPFHNNPKANITYEVFNAFRKENFMIGAYFSKPDWDCEYYWWPYYATPDRHVNYDPAKHPDRWKNFKDYTFNQIEELMRDYGDIDILWLDGAWVQPLANLPKAYESWAKKLDWNQDIDMPRIVKNARKYQPGLIVVDRWVPGQYENYLTPEQKIPEKALDYPWESCITMTDGWSYEADQKCKPLRQLIHMLVDIVAKGGNFLLNIGPAPDGTWTDETYQRLAEIGDWMKINSEAIYDSSPMAPYKEGKICLTRNDATGVVYTIYLAGENEHIFPEKINFSNFFPAEGTEVKILGLQGQLQWKRVGKGCIIELPKVAEKNIPCKYAWAIKISKIVCN